MTKEEFKKVSLKASYKNIIEALIDNSKECISSLGLFLINLFFVVLDICILPIYPIIYFMLKNWTILTWEARQKKINKEVESNMERQFGKTQRSKR